jgi:hypothetical protein
VAKPLSLESERIDRQALPSANHYEAENKVKELASPTDNEENFSTKEELISPKKLGRRRSKKRGESLRGFLKNIKSS